MSQATAIPVRSSRALRLESGDHLDQQTFHERYVQAPPEFEAELVEGVVIVQASLAMPHGDYHSIILGWLVTYRAATPGTRTFDNATLIVDDENEVQPDASLVIEPEYGGQTKSEGEYLSGAPELVVEVASSSAAYDLHSKMRLYEKAGVREYVVLSLAERELYWFEQDQGRFRRAAVPQDGIYRSNVFSGLWLDERILLRADAAGVLETLKRGLADPAHAAFAEKLQKQRPS